jgi:hypothetical protein
MKNNGLGGWEGNKRSKVDFYDVDELLATQPESQSQCRASAELSSQPLLVESIRDDTQALLVDDTQTQCRASAEPVQIPESQTQCRASAEPVQIPESQTQLVATVQDFSSSSDYGG